VAGAAEKQVTMLKALKSRLMFRADRRQTCSHDPVVGI
jgi:hypothetical protein